MGVYACSRRPLARSLAIYSRHGTTKSPTFSRNRFEISLRSISTPGASGPVPTGGLGSETHGGDDIHLVDHLVCDFSVTTNALGPVPVGLDATRALMGDFQMAWITPRGGDVNAIMQEVEDNASQHLASSPAIEHYPPRADVELEQLTSSFLAGSEEDADAVRQKLLFGNGASELIDLVCRLAPDGKYCISPHVQVQYREYQRACVNAGRTETAIPKEASVICLVNPNNPTGDFLERADMETWIAKNVAPGTWVIVDESMLFWAGSDWHRRGVSASFIDRMAKGHVHVFLVQSWTKIFSCTGLRIGTVVCPTTAKKNQLQAKQVPWSVNAFARAYLKAALQDSEYLERTWSTTSRWRSHMVSRLQRLYPDWKFYGQPWLSWIWIDTGSPDVADRVYQTALRCGCPIRHARSGYGMPSFVRLAVRRPYDFSVLYQALLQQEYSHYAGETVSFGTYADVQPSVVEGVRLVHIDDLLPHEEVLTDRSQKLQEYVSDLSTKVLPAIVVDSQFQVVIDGHHRLEVFRQAGMRIVPVVSVNYDHEDIIVNPPGIVNGVSKETVISSAFQGKLLSPKSTQHMVRSRGGAILPIIVLAPQIAELAKLM